MFLFVSMGLWWATSDYPFLILPKLNFYNIFWKILQHLLIHSSDHEKQFQALL